MTRQLQDTANALVAAGKGLLAMDESSPTCDRRFAAAGIPQTEQARQAYRELLITTPGLGGCISGAILYDETIRQRDRHGTPFTDRLMDGGIMPGIKVDLGAKSLALHPGETVTEGLDGLRDRLLDYARRGARFAKWRAVIAMGPNLPSPSLPSPSLPSQGRPSRDLPSQACIGSNAQALARYAALCQEAGLVPIVEPEVLMAGDHSLERCGEVTQEVLRAVFGELHAQGVALEAVILKPNMVLPGLDCPGQASVDQVARATLACLLRTVPAAVAGVAFLSGGQSGELASARLNAMNVQASGRDGRAPWPLVFSFARAIQQPALQIWGGKDANVAAAQQAVLLRARCNHAALRGEYRQSMERRQDYQRAS